MNLHAYDFQLRMLLNCTLHFDGKFVLQRDNNFFPVWAYVLPTTIARLPMSVIDSLLWVC